MVQLLNQVYRLGIVRFRFLPDSNFFRHRIVGDTNFPPFQRRFVEKTKKGCLVGEVLYLVKKKTIMSPFILDRGSGFFEIPEVYARHQQAIGDLYF